ncbi:hypothetical protein BBFGKLBO_02314 [Synechococcus sp. CBW1107]|nr:hypothetical protein BBFGKLBO_02314 [Synechococcus sp. CBW1107]
MLRLHGDRATLLAALTAHWADQQLGLAAVPLRRVRRLRSEDRGPSR